jgi:hypothetical protein
VIAIDLLKTQHAELRTLCRQLEIQPNNSHTDCQQTHAAQLSHLLHLHVYLEEKFLYPVLTSYPELTADLHNMRQNHREMVNLLVKFNTETLNTSLWFAYLLAIKERIEASIQDEELWLFPALQQRMPVQWQLQLGHQLEQSLRKIRHPPMETLFNGPIR